MATRENISPFTLEGELFWGVCVSQETNRAHSVFKSSGRRVNNLQITLHKLSLCDLFVAVMLLTLQGARGSLRNSIAQRQDEEHWAKYEMVIFRA